MKLFRLFNVAILCMALTMVSCSGEDGADGEDGDIGQTGPAGADGTDGTDGTDGIACWDLNGNGVGDVTDGTDNEDLNGDEVVDALDCQGVNGTDGADGNANVFRSDILITDFAGSNLNFDLANIVSAQDLGNYIILFYLKNAIQCGVFGARAFER